MPLYKIKAPDGSIIPVNAPDGATEQDAMEYAASVWKPAEPTVAENIAKPFMNVIGSVAEPVAQMATGYLAKPMGELAGFGTMAANAITGNEVNPADMARAVQEKLTYQPKTYLGSSEYNPLNYLSTKLGQGIGQVSNFAADLVGQGNTDNTSLQGMAANAVREAIPQGIGFLGVNKGAPVLEDTIARSNAARFAELQQLKRDNATLDATRKAVQDAGYKTPAEEGIKLTVSGLTSTNKHISSVNEKIATKGAARDMGLKEGEPLSPAAIDAEKAKGNEAYDNIVKAGFKEKQVSVPAQQFTEWGTPETTTRMAGLETPPEYTAKIQGMIDQINKSVKEYPEANAPLKASLPILEEQLGKFEHDPQEAMTLMRNFREQASKIYKNDNASITDHVIASTKYGLAKMLEDVFEYNLKDKPAIFEAFRNARTKLAKIHFIEDIYNDTTGKVDIQKGVQLSEKYPELTGNLKTMVDFGKAYPQASARVRGAVAPVTMMDALFATGALASGHPLIAAGEIGARVIAPKFAEKGLLQQKTPNYNLGMIRNSVTAVPSAIGLLSSSIPLQSQQYGMLQGQQQ